MLTQAVSNYRDLFSKQNESKDQFIKLKPGLPKYSPSNSQIRTEN